ncbi:hypothetical protein M8C13_00520 [Crossiella sp. SN42]|uniref:hypothetical protein n=1 Tax=Crossiella sp. SN42 TaxID=2944808 RepID=UPI00207CAF3B|nr:hypothetical protein [Crossiella sp. SN42]MCO1574241.1 hypothetical protein [Crossiella sp. SN42]
MESQRTAERVRACLAELMPSFGPPVVLTPLTVVPSTEVVSSGHGLRRKVGMGFTVALGFVESLFGGASDMTDESRHTPPAGFIHTDAGRFVGFDEEIDQLDRWVVSDGAAVAVVEENGEDFTVCWRSGTDSRPEAEDVGGDVPYLRLSFADGSQVGLRMTAEERATVLAAL